ncbi:MAG: lasso peptide biosynthesis B2 protein [Legionellaceae bacterium]|nr:lasso peptide biosynthesis B2 protein [Legionellaceae bacterium]
MTFSCRISSAIGYEKILLLTAIIFREDYRTTRYTPWTLTCLTQALIAKGWCRYYQIPYLLFIGIDKTPTHLSQREAHAWVTAGPISITGGGHQCFQTHHVISSFSNAR